MTAMQELIEFINTNGFPRNEISMIELEDKLTELLEKEKQQASDVPVDGKDAIAFWEWLLKNAYVSYVIMS